MLLGVCSSVFLSKRKSKRPPPLINVPDAPQQPDIKVLQYLFIFIMFAGRFCKKM